MHVLAATSLVVSLWLSPAPVKTYKGKPLDAVNVTEAGWELQKLPGEKSVGIFATPTDRWPAWNDDGKFPLEVNLTWAGIDFLVTKPKLERLKLYIIDCGSTDNAEKYFTLLRLSKSPDYARSGKFLIKASPQALEWFTKHYGAVRYEIAPKAPAKDK
jgi:hypothetical protein